ncbi:MAG: TolC family protein [Candidatus Hydrogenedentes bacterium]|nr:TolC family protein [Candidatus Hydrogenedentota bacterium]
MHKRLCRTAAAGALALCWGTAWSQDPPPPAPPTGTAIAAPRVEVVQSAPDSEGKTQRYAVVSTPINDFGEAIDVSQESSPEVAIAEAQLREAEARLRQARMEAAQRAVQATHIRKLVDIARKNAEEVEASAQAGVASHRDLLEAQQRLAEAEANLATQEAELKVLGNAPRLERSGGLRTLEAQIPVPRPELNKEAKTETEMALEAPMSAEFDQETLSNVFGFISDYLDVNIVIDVGLQVAEKKVSIKVENVPLRDGLLALADVYGDLCFIVRDYGIFATTPERAATINAPSIPAGIPLYVSASSEMGRRGAGVFKAFRFGAGMGEGIPTETGGPALEAIPALPPVPAVPGIPALPPSSGGYGHPVPPPAPEAAPKTFEKAPIAESAPPAR